MSDSSTKTAIITGASGGIGRAVALRLARDGFAVADAVERVHAKLEQVAEDLETWKSTSVNTAYPLAIDH